MSRRHKGDTKEFGALNFAEQARSITAAINNLQAAIEHHAEHSPRRMETIKKCLSQIDRLRQRLRSISERRGIHPVSGQTVRRVEGVPRIHVRSPRLAKPECAADFTMDVAEESADAGVQ